MKEKSCLIKVPIYNTRFELVATDDMIKSQKKEPRFSFLGKQKPTDAHGLAMYCDWNFCVILDSRCVNHNVIAHEIFHATHRILDYCGLKFKVGNQEAFAHLNGYLSDFTYHQLKKWKIKIK